MRKCLDQLYDEYVGIHLKAKKFIDYPWEARGEILKDQSGGRNEKIAVDAMGGDHAPQALVEGVKSSYTRI